MSKRKNRDRDEDDDDEDYIPEEDDYLPEDHYIHSKDIINKSKKNKLSSSLVKAGLGSSEDGLNVFQDYTNLLVLKQDHVKRPIWITKHNYIYLGILKSNVP